MRMRQVIFISKGYLERSGEEEQEGKGNYINVMSYPRVQYSPTSKPKFMKTQEKKNPNFLAVSRLSSRR